MARLKYSFCVFISLGHKPMQILASHNVWLGATILVRCLHQVGVLQEKEPGWGRADGHGVSHKLKTEML